MICVCVYGCVWGGLWEWGEREGEKRKRKFKEEERGQFLLWGESMLINPLHPFSILLQLPCPAPCRSYYLRFFAPLALEGQKAGGERSWYLSPYSLSHLLSLPCNHSSSWAVLRSSLNLTSLLLALSFRSRGGNSPPLLLVPGCFSILCSCYSCNTYKGISSLHWIFFN